MPNWCSNCLRITGPADKIKELAEKIGDKFTFNSLVSQPKELFSVFSGFITIDGKRVKVWQQVRSDTGELFNGSWQEQVALKDQGVIIENRVIPQETLDRWIRSFGATNLYDWNIQNYGTKWNIKACDVEVNDLPDGTSYISMNFDTAWSPPSTFCETASSMYPDLTFELAYAEVGSCFWGVSTYKDGVGDDEYNEGGDSFWQKDLPEDAWDHMESHEMVTPDCAAHLERWGLHTGG